MNSKEYINKIVEQYQIPPKFPQRLKDFDPETSESAMIETQFNYMQYQKIENFSKRLNVSVFSVFLGIITGVCSKILNCQRLTIATPINMNTQSNQEINANLNTVLLNIDCTMEQSVTEYFEKIYFQFQEGIRFSDVDYGRVVKKINNNGSPIFNILVNNDYSIKDRVLNNKKIRIHVEENHNTKVPLEFYCINKETSIRLKVVYDKTTFSREFIYLILKEISRISELVNNDSIQKLFQLFSVKNTRKTNIDINSFKTVVELIYEAMLKNPAKIAVQDRDGCCYTYSQLWERARIVANSINNELKDQNNPILIDGERSFNNITYILGIWLSGNIIVPVDKSQPIARVKKIVDTSKIKYVLGNVRKLSSILNLKQINLLTRIRDKSISFPSYKNNAYIYYTSGSTGEPKGIIGWHGALSNFICWEKTLFSSNDKVFQITMPFFDVYLRDILTPLVVGAKICIPSDNEMMIAQQALKYIKDNHITNLHIVPSLAKTWLLDTKTVINVAGLKKTFFAGEALDNEFISRWKHKFPNTLIYNLYGPTEATLAKFCKRVDNYSAELIPVGKPISASQVLICNYTQNNKYWENSKYEIGEVIIKSSYITKGYIAKKFSNEYYHTGDLGYIDSKGDLFLIGRKDDQIKIDGVRIQPKEIENILLSYKSIDWVKILLVDGHIQAYLKLNSNITQQNLRNYLVQRLPMQFIPQRFLMIDEVPLKTNGKLDRKWLVTHGKNINDTLDDKPYELKNNTEELISLLVKEITNKFLKPKDNFFRVGVNSLMIARLISIVNRFFSIRITYSKFLEEPSIVGMSNYIRTLSNYDIEKISKKILDNMKG